ncbi:placenta-specific gene 8 protein-like [Mytilus edulis]|uniref:placenta-specific gene 8 protein-like n=1 Tax=Mytilus edulis TaxID=6550 RepID=UPI0039F00568
MDPANNQIHPHNQFNPQVGNPIPMQNQVTTIVIAQPQQLKNSLLLVDVRGSREWSTGLCDCFSDIGNCFFTWCCYCCAVSSLASRIGECCCTTCCVPAAEINIRTRIRTMGGIRGDMCNDCMTVCCCGPCAACQEGRELKNMGI